MDLKGINWQVAIFGEISSRQEDAASGYHTHLQFLDTLNTAAKFQRETSSCFCLQPGWSVILRN